MLIMQHKEILGFNGEYRFLSNFWYCEVVFEDQKYRSVEHAYVAAKTLHLNLRKRIQKVNSAGEVKHIGRNLQLRPDWEDIKLEVMANLVYQKFLEEPLRSQLLATEDAYLEETNHWGDTYWGVCKGVGENMLGKILMMVRDII